MTDSMADSMAGGAHSLSESDHGSVMDPSKTSKHPITYFTYRTYYTHHTYHSDREYGNYYTHSRTTLNPLAIPKLTMREGTPHPVAHFEIVSSGVHDTVLDPSSDRSF